LDGIVLKRSRGLTSPTHRIHDVTALLKEIGFETAGVTLRRSDSDTLKPNCV
jgi:hypothetical protein